MKSENSSSFNGKAQGELYSPEYATRINTEKKGKERKSEEEIDKGQGELYSPEKAVRISAYPQQKQDSDHLKVKEAEAKSRKGKAEETNEKQSSGSLGKLPSSKL